ncbi:IS630 transposase-related protein [Candidatus Rhabdochlamydia porcellionis]|uniref:IS630 transposase-related protein n=1 Tax=Candidatus Rhabdochlamydia porcellionis TaxID=225148 RepID=UPI001C7DFF13|nr:IS630 transposase-related protein [Candidatus Rhabdochlamydia porcellionis]
MEKGNSKEEASQIFGVTARSIFNWIKRKEQRRLAPNKTRIGFILCGVLAATINAMSAQVLVLSSNISEDFYKRSIQREVSGCTNRNSYSCIPCFFYCLCKN